MSKNERAQGIRTYLICVDSCEGKVVFSVVFCFEGKVIFSVVFCLSDIRVIKN